MKQAGMNRFSLLALVLVLVVVCLAPGVVNGLSGDDYVHVYKNRGGPADWGGYFLQADGREYRPLVRLSLAIDHAIWAKWYSGYHLTNLLLHLLVTSLLFIFLEGITGDWRIGLLAALVFGLHPIHSYSINAIMGRTDILCALFGLLALFAAARGLPVTSGLLLLLALLSKELGVVLPLLFGLALLLFRPLRRAPQWRALAILFGIDIVYLVVRFTVLAPAREDLAVYFAASPAGLLRNLAYYAGGLVLPIGHYWLRDLSEVYPFAFAAIACLAALSLGFYLFSRRKDFLAPDLAFGFLWVVVSLLPVVFLFQRRFLYLASLGFALAAGYLIVRRSGRYLALVATALALLLGLSLFGKSREWRDAAIESRAAIQKLDVLLRSSAPTRLYVLNAPHSRGDAHLFTHDSLRYAVALEMNRLPEIETVTRVSLRPGDFLTNRVGPGRVTTRLKPGPETYFVFDAPELLPSGGRLLPVGWSMVKGPFVVAVTGLDGRGRVAEVTVSWRGLTPGEEWVLL